MMQLFQVVTKETGFKNGKGHPALTILSLTPDEICLVQQQLKNLAEHPLLFFIPHLQIQTFLLLIESLFENHPSLIPHL